MAITVNPPAYTVLPAYSVNSLVFDVTSDAPAQDLQIRALVLYRRSSIGEAFVKVGTKRQNKVIGQNYFRFNFEGFAQSLLFVGTIDNFATGIYRDKNGLVEIYIIFTEEYRGESGFVEDHSINNLPYLQVPNMVKQITENQSIENFVINNSGLSENEFLTKRKRDIFRQKGDMTILSFLVLSNFNFRAVINFYDLTGSIVHQQILNYTVGTPDDVLVKKYNLILNDIFSEHPTAIKASVVLDAVIGGSNTKISETFNIFLDSNCYRNKTQVFWLNTEGGLDDYTFTADLLRKSKVKKEEAEKEPTGNYMSRGRTVLSVNSNDEVTLYSQFEDDDTMNYLQAIFESPEVFIFENGALVPIMIETGGQEYEGRKLQQLKVTYTKSNKKIVQNG